MKAIKLLLFGILIFSLIGCAPPPAAPAPAPEAPAAPTEAPAEPEAAPAPEAITLRYFMWDPSFEEKEQQMLSSKNL